MKAALKKNTNSLINTYYTTGQQNSCYVSENCPDDYKIESTTLWSFPDRGKWSTHSGSYRGNWSPYIPRNVILRYTKEGDVVLDQFLGSGTTLIEAALLKRKGVGIDINLQSVELSHTNINTLLGENSELTIKQGNACNLSFISKGTIDLICTHPPYSNIIQYSKNIDDDLSNLDIDDFLIKMKDVAAECFRVLKNDKYCAILMGDTRRKKHIIPLGFRVMDIFINSGFVLKEIIIKEQHNCKSTSFWYSRSIAQNFLLIAHEYLFVFRKP